MPRLTLRASLSGLGLVLVAVAVFLWVRGSPPPPEPVATLTPKATTVPTPEGRAVSSPTPYDMGKALFLAKGCIGCHWHAKAGAPSSAFREIGPTLTNIETVPYANLPNDIEFLRKWLMDPKALKPGTAMPNLGLSNVEIEHLLAFLLPNKWVPKGP